MNIRFWFIRETEKARLYSKVPINDPRRSVESGDTLWIPRSIVEHTSKRGVEHTLDLPDWFIEKEKL